MDPMSVTLVIIVIAIGYLLFMRLQMRGRAKVRRKRIKDRKPQPSYEPPTGRNDPDQNIDFNRQD